jgi:uncharacterized membrane protein
MTNKNFIYQIVIFSLFFGCSGNSEDTEPEQLQPEKVTYNNKIKGLFSNNCISCHSGSTDPGMPSTIYTSYSDVKSYIEEILVRVNSTSNPMPPAPNAPLTIEEKNLLQQWKDDGLLEK